MKRNMFSDSKYPLLSSNNRINAAAAKLLAPGIAKNKGLETLLVSKLL